MSRPGVATVQTDDLQLWRLMLTSIKAQTREGTCIRRPQEDFRRHNVALT